MLGLTSLNRPARQAFCCCWCGATAWRGSVWAWSAGGSGSDFKNYTAFVALAAASLVAYVEAAAGKHTEQACGATNVGEYPHSIERADEVLVCQDSKPDGLTHRTSILGRSRHRFFAGTRVHAPRR